MSRCDVILCWAVRFPEGSQHAGESERDPLFTAHVALETVAGETAHSQQQTDPTYAEDAKPDIATISVTMRKAWVALPSQHS